MYYFRQKIFWLLLKKCLLSTQNPRQYKNQMVGPLAGGLHIYVVDMLVNRKEDMCIVYMLVSRQEDTVRVDSLV